jgi:hypothetical protein
MNVPENMKPADEVVNIAVTEFCQYTTDLGVELEKRLQALESRTVKLELEVEAARECVSCIGALAADTASVKQKLRQLLALRRLPPNPPVN